MHSNPERLAWRILIAAFGIFILLCSTVAYVIQWYVFQSTVPTEMELQSARGTASLTLPNMLAPAAVTDIPRAIEPGAVISTDPNSQAIVTLADPRTKERIASIVLFRDSKVTVGSASAPRFGLNAAPYQIELEGVSGRIEILLLDTGKRQTYLHISSAQMTAEIQAVGRYLVNASGNQTRFTTRTGIATVISHQTATSITLTDEQRTIVTTSNRPTSTDAEHSLLKNPFFSEDFNLGWQFYNDRTPPGQAYNAVFDGRPVVVIDRSQSNYPGVQLGHAETGLVQNLSLKASDLASLELRATFYVEEQDVPRCGDQGSECPIMLHMLFQDAQGSRQEFYHGFYANDNPAVNLPETCLSCRSNHDRITARSWFTYESGNLFTLFSEEQRPVFITQVSFYASGHAYKIYVSEMDLIGSQ